MSSDLVLLGAVGLAAYYFYQQSTKMPTLVIPDDLSNVIDNIITNPTPQPVAGGAMNLSSSNIFMPPGGIPSNLGGVLTSPEASVVSDLIKENVAEVAISKMSMALLNEAGNRRVLAEYRAEQALKRKQEASLKKLGVLEQKKLKLDAVKDKYNLQLANAQLKREQGKLDRTQAQMTLIQKDQAILKTDARQQSLAQMKTDSKMDLIKARQNSTTQAQLVGKSNTNRPTLGVLKNRIMSNFAVRLNNARVSIKTQMANFRLPRFTTRGAVHGGASLFGLIVFAYDMVRMFDPRIDIWKQNRGTNNPVPEQVVVPGDPEPFPQQKSFTNLPSCDQVVEDGTATPTNPVLCRENAKKPWEELRYDGLAYLQKCPPQWHSGAWNGVGMSSGGFYERCTLATNYAGEYYDVNSEKSPPWWNVSNSTTGNTGIEGREWNRLDLIEPNMPNLYASLPDSYFERMGLKQFVTNLNLEINKTPTVVTYDTLPTWASDVAYSIDTPLASFNVNDYVDFSKTNQGGVTPAGLYVKSGANDIDWPYYQMRTPPAWNEPGQGAASMLVQMQQDRETGKDTVGKVWTASPYLGDFGRPYSDVGLSVRGGESLTAEQKIRALYPDASADEIDSAIVNANAEAIANN